jgi:hypothetical protein
VRTTKHNWEKMVRSLANSTAIYHYPQEDAWTFIIPSTQEELKNDIRDFCLGREPKFELVYEEYSESPILQFDLETDLKRHKVEELFPAPIGESFKGLENFFRAVRVKSPWKGIGIRFDIRFLDESSHSDWNTGKWLVEKGGRIY